MKALVMASLLSVWLCACTADSEAQIDGCYVTLASSWYGFAGPVAPPVPATAYDFFNGGPWTFYYRVNTPACAPPPQCPSCTDAGSPIDLATGNTYVRQTDVRIPGLGGGLTLTRTWNSIPAMSGSMFGPQWSSSFEERVFLGGDGYVRYARGDGSVWFFGYIGQSNNVQSYAVAGRWANIYPHTGAATLSQDLTNATALDSSWVLVLESGEQRTFTSINQGGQLLAIVDRNGNTIQLTYDTSGRLSAVTDAASRHLYFSYTNIFVTNITSDVGISLSYTYDNSGRLMQYTKPDNTTVTFQYNDPNPNLITAVLDGDGKILESHTYDGQRRGLTSSRAGGVDAVTVTYPVYP